MSGNRRKASLALGAVAISTAGLGLVYGLSSSLAPAAADPRRVSGPQIKIAGPDEMVIPASEFSCSTPDSPTDGSKGLDVPDAPPRMWRRYDNSYELVAAHHNNIPFYSSDGRQFARRGCASIFPSRQDPDPSNFSDQDWIVGVYTLDGRNVFALVHDEFHGPAHIPACKARLGPGQPVWAQICLSIAQTAAISNDGGTSFRPLGGDLRIVAAPEIELSPTNVAALTQTSVRDPSNIVRSPTDKYYYFVANVVNGQDSGNQQPGTCLFRSKDPFTQAWLAWDGSGFNHRFSSPYHADRSAGNTCRPIFPKTMSISALSYNTVIGAFLAVGKNTDRQLFAVTSRDLIHWSTPQVLRRSVQDNWWRPLSGDPDPDGYYSIIDPTSPSPSFDVSGSKPYIYYVHWNVGLKSVKNHERDVKRVPLKISPG